uniref:DNA damage-regulated autophagy modulator protein 2 n=2 Tax=Parascaris univalens TaxID=6257 RepID=A0A914ZFE4_PARUN
MKVINKGIRLTMVFKHVWIIPTLATLFAFLAFFIGYGVGIAADHLEAWFSFISDGGALPPESCIFGEFLNLSAMFVAITIYVRHLQIVVFYGKIHHVAGRWRLYSTIMMCIGYVIAFGVSLVANVQETSIPILHGIGAMLAFFCAVIYIWAQLIFTFTMRPTLTHNRITCARVILAMLTTVGLILYVVVHFANPFVPREQNGQLPTRPPKIDGIIRIPSDSPYFKNHLVATLAEWILGVSLYLFVLSFALELRFTFAHAPKIALKPAHKNVSKVYPIMNIPTVIVTNSDSSSVDSHRLNQENISNGNGYRKPNNEYHY